MATTRKPPALPLPADYRPVFGQPVPASYQAAAHPASQSAPHVRPDAPAAPDAAAGADAGAAPRLNPRFVEPERTRADWRPVCADEEEVLTWVVSILRYYAHELLGVPFPWPAADGGSVYPATRGGLADLVSSVWPRNPHIGPDLLAAAWWCSLEAREREALAAHFRHIGGE